MTAATCHLFHFKAAGVTQVLRQGGQEKVLGALGRWQPPCEGGDSRWLPADGVLFSSAGSAASTAQMEEGVTDGFGRSDDIESIFVRMESVFVQAGEEGAREGQ